MNIQLAAQHSRPVSHDPETHASGRNLFVGHSRTVILHGENAPFADAGERHDKTASPSVTDRVVNRFLSDSIEMKSPEIVERKLGIFGPQQTFDPEMLAVS